MPKPFRALIKNVELGWYSDGRGGWTMNPADAFDHGSGIAALRAARAMQKENLQVVLKFQDSRYDILLDLEV
jgi:hypothetical protein